MSDSSKLKRKWTIRLIHHTHLDIGYTHTQEEVLQRQFRHLEKAMDLADKSRNRPEEARFRWNPEGTWALEEWLCQADDPQKQRFAALVREGLIGLDGLYGNLLTGLCRPEELMENFIWKRKLEEVTGTPIDSAMITDVPGWNWGLVTALAENGISYLSAGPNHFDRIGYTLKEWGDKPFYWISPSGKEKVLLFVHGKGYAWFHTGLNRERNLRNKLTPRRIIPYLRKLEKSGYPYDTVLVRYNIGSDNGPPDENLSEIVETWNRDHPRMKMVLSTTSLAMRAFEEEYGDRLPEFRGDFTPYWEDGAFSTARETAITREAADRLTQASVLSVISGETDRQEDRYDAAWKDVLLYNEHTWGAHNSVRRPDHPFARQQWAWKAGKALSAAETARTMTEKAAGGRLLAPLFYGDRLEAAPPAAGPAGGVRVFNTQSWPVTRLVRLRSRGNRVLDARGEEVPSQKMEDGTLAFPARNVPPAGCLNFTVSEGRGKEELPAGGSPGEEETCGADDWTLWNDRVRVVVNPADGSLSSLTLDGREMISQEGPEQFNAPVYIAGRHPVFRRKGGAGKDLRITVTDRGPLIAAIRVEQTFRRIGRVRTDISLTAFDDRVRISHLLDRPVVRKKEGLHFAFPFRVTDPAVRYDTAWGTAEAGRDQLKGANRNYISASRWVDVSDETGGVTCVLTDAPLFETGKISNDPRLTGWYRESAMNGTVYSYVMNNYWHTNYKADQPGKTLFRYTLLPHGVFDGAEAGRLALEEMQPLLAAAGEGVPAEGSLISLSDNRIVMTSARQEGKDTVLRLFNPAGESAEAEMTFRDPGTPEVLSPGKGDCLQGRRLRLAAGETVQIRLRS